MKKAVIAASACFVAGLIGCTISLPMVAKDVIHLYNDTVSETANFYTTQDLPAGITELRMVNQDTMGMSLVEVRQSPDDQIHLQVYRSEFSGFDAEIVTEGNKAEIILKEVPSQNLQISKELLVELIRDGIHSQNNLILEVPKTVSLTSSETDGVYFGVDGGVEFVNSQLVHNYRYVPSENQNWKIQYEESLSQIEQLEYQVEELTQENRMLQEELESLYEDSEETDIIVSPSGEMTIEEPLESNETIFPSDIIQKETELSKQRDMFKEWKISKDDYIRTLNSMSRDISNARQQQVIQAGREDVLPMVEETADLILEYNRIDAQILNAQRDYNEGFITQEQYNSIVQSYETSIRSMSEQINVWKTSLKEQGYDWNSAVVTPNL